MSTRILIADDHKIIRDGLHALLEKEKDMEVVAFAENGRKAIKKAKKINPDIIIMDISMPDLNGIDATRQILSEVKNTKIIALSTYSDRPFVVGMIKAGASGYLLKDCAFEELAVAIRTVVNGQTYLSPGISGAVIKSIQSQVITDEVPCSISELTGREREVLQLISEGKTTKAIAARLNVSIKTIETHRQNIMAKLNANSIAELTKIAVKEGLTTL